MATLRVDTFAFHFEPNHAASKYDAWDYYRRVLQPQANQPKAVDVVAAKRTGLRPPCCWLIEAKDFRTVTGTPGSKNDASGLPQLVADKAIDTWAGLQDRCSAESHATTSLALWSGGNTG